MRSAQNHDCSQATRLCAINTNSKPFCLYNSSRTVSKPASTVLCQKCWLLWPMPRLVLSFYTRAFPTLSDIFWYWSCKIHPLPLTAAEFTLLNCQKWARKWELRTVDITQYQSVLLPMSLLVHSASRDQLALATVQEESNKSFFVKWIVSYTNQFWRF